MRSRSAQHPIARSTHGHLPGAVAVSSVHPSEQFDVNVILRRRANENRLPAPDELGSQPPAKRQHISREEFEERYGADPNDIERVRTFATTHGLRVTQVSIPRRTITLAGSTAQFATAFSVVLIHMAHAGGAYRSHYGPVRIPDELKDVVTAVIGFDNRPVASPKASPHPFVWSGDQVEHSRAAAARVSNGIMREKAQRLTEEYATSAAATPERRDFVDAYHRWLLSASDPATTTAAGLQSWIDVNQSLQAAQTRFSELAGDYLSDLSKAAVEAERVALLAALDELDIKTPPRVGELYHFPPDADGAGQCIAIIELGGGYRHEDLQNYFAFLGMAMPVISDVSVSGGSNAPGIYEPFDGEVCLDIEVIGGAAPGAKLVCYFAPLNAKGFIEAVHTAIHDRENRPSVLSISWDLSEAFWLETPMFLDQFEEVLQEAAVLGITVCCSAGDYGPSSEFLDGRAWVDYPASSPHVLGCGGTSLYSRANTILAEVVWNTAAKFFQATGGGVSQVFPLPPWQQTADVPDSANPGGGRGRGVPDVAANADPTTGYLVQVDGRTTVICGTSAGAPLWAALIARINQSLGFTVGYLNPYLYQSVDHAQAFRDTVIGSNGVYPARKGWDACTGWGTPHGTRLRDALRANP